MTLPGFSLRSCGLALGLFVVLAATAFAAAPTVTYLYPAGGQRGTKVEVAVGGTFDKWPAKVWVSGKGVTAEPEKKKGTLAVTIGAEAVPGVYYLRCFNDEGASGLRPFVVGTLPEVMEKEPNDEPQSPQLLKGTALIVNGRLEKAADVDGYAVTLRKGQTLLASLDGNRTFKSPMDAILQVLSADGFVVAENHDHDGLDPQVAFTAPKDGTYVVRIFAFPSMPDSSIRHSGADTYVYRLTLTTEGFADFPVPLAVSRSAPTPVAVQGWNIPPAAKTLPVPVTPNGDAAVLTHAGLANTLSVRLEPHPTFDFASQVPTKLAPLAAPFSLTGRLEKSAPISSWPVNAKKSQPLTIEVLGRSLGLPIAPVIRVLDESKAVLVRAEPAKVGGDTTLSFRPPVDGRYTIEVKDLYGEAGPRFAYLLRVTTGTPDYTLTMPTDRLFIVPGKPLEQKLAVARLNGFKGDVTVNAVGLPAGVKVETVPPTGKPDPATILLRFSSDTPTSGGSFRVVGTVKGEPTLTRTARATDPELGEPTTDLWASVTDSPKPPPPPKKKK